MRHVIVSLFVLLTLSCKEQDVTNAGGCYTGMYSLHDDDAGVTCWQPTGAAGISCLRDERKP